MGKAEIGTAKYQSKQLKAAGLQKLRFYCQICEKQCRDANGFKNHLSSLSHQKKIEDLSKNGRGNDIIEEFSENFSKDFLRLLKINHGTKKINANKFYQEYILHDKNHIHMNSTKWSTLTSFVKYLGGKGYVRVEQPETATDSEFNLEIRLIDTSSEYYQKQQQSLQKQKNLKTDEEVSMKLINEQIKRGQNYLKKYQFQESPRPEEPVMTSSDPIKVSLKNKPVKKNKIRAVFDSDSEDELKEESAQLKKRKTTNIGEISNKLLSKN